MRLTSKALIALIVLAIAGCAQQGYEYKPLSFTQTPIDGYKEEQQKQEQEAYSNGTINCDTQTIFSKDDCVLALYTKVSPTPESLKLLTDSGVKTPADYDNTIINANKYKDYQTNSNSSPLEKWRKVAAYIRAKKSADSNNLTIEQNDAIGKKNWEKLNKKLNEEFPYNLEITCTMGGTLMQVVMCFAPPYGYASGTELEIKNGDFYQMYQFMQVDRAGSYINGTLLITLKKNFKITAQNSSNNAILNVVIKKSATNEIVFQKSTGQYGVITVRN